MKNQKMYEPDDKMINLIKDNYSLLQSLGCFGISLGFGDKTVSISERVTLIILITSCLSFEEN